MLRYARTGCGKDAVNTHKLCPGNGGSTILSDRAKVKKEGPKLLL